MLARETIRRTSVSHRLFPSWLSLLKRGRQRRLERLKKRHDFDRSAAETLEDRTLLTPTVGLYNEDAVEPNGPDQLAAGSAMNSDQLRARIQNDVLGFDFDADFAGVIDAEEFSLDWEYGINAIKTLRLTPVDGTTFTQAEPNTIPVPISRDGAFSSTTVGGHSFTSIDFTVLNGVANEQVFEFGLTILGRDNTDYETVTVEARLAGGGSHTASSVIFGDDTDSDTFFGFTAPLAEYYTGFSITYEGAANESIWFDDIGFRTQQVTPGSIAGQAWHDVDADGVQDPEEPGIQDAVAELFRTGNAIIGDADDVSIQTMVTDGNGNYLFETLGADNYYVMFHNPVGFDGFGPANVTNDAVDSDVNPFTARTGLITLAASENETDVDAGMTGDFPAFGFAMGLGNGGSSVDSGTATAVDNAGDVYLAMRADDPVDVDSGPGTVNIDPQGSSTIFAKYTSVGALIWEGSLDSTVEVIVEDMTVDAAGDIIITGQFSGIADFDMGPRQTLLTSPGGSPDIFVAKYDLDGELIWAREIGAGSVERATSVAIDSQDDILVTGHFLGSVDFDPGLGTSSLNAGTTQDAFILKLDSNGDFVWASSIETAGVGAEAAAGWDVTVDSNDDVVFGGQFSGIADVEPGPGTTLANGGTKADIFIAKVDGINGTGIWTRTMGGITGTDNAARGVAVDENNNVFATGQFADTVDFDPGAGVFPLTGDLFGDAFVLQLDPAGTFISAVGFGGSSFDAGIELAMLPGSGFRLAGRFDSTVDFDPSAAVFNRTSAGNGDFFVADYDLFGNFLDVATFGNSDFDELLGFDFDALGTVYLSGGFAGTVDFDPAGTFNITSNGGTRDAFLAKLFSTRTGTISDVVWHDVNMDGIQDPGEPGIEGAVVELFDTVDGLKNDGNADNDVSLGIVVTDASGNYRFDNLPAGAYYAAFRPPVGFDFAPQDAGGDDALDSDADPADGTTDVITLGPGIINTDVDAGLVDAFTGFGFPGFGFALTGGGQTVFDDAVARKTVSDSAGNIYFAGDFDGNADFDWGPADTNSMADPFGRSFFLAKYTPVGALIWSRTFGGGTGSSQFLNGLGLDATGNVFVNGSFEGLADYDPGAAVTTLISAGGQDAFVASFDQDGGFRWAHSFGNNGHGTAEDLAVDSVGNVYSTGTFEQTVDFDPLGGAPLVVQGLTGVFVQKLDGDGNLVWATANESGGTLTGHAITTDPNDDVIVGGVFGAAGADFDPSGGVEFLAPTTAGDAFVWKLDSLGNHLWAASFEGRSEVRGVAADDDGSIVSTGFYSTATDFDPGAGTDTPPTNGQDDIFVSRLDANGNHVWVESFGNAGDDRGHGVTIDRTRGLIYTVGEFQQTIDFDPGIGVVNLTDPAGAGGYMSVLDEFGNFEDVAGFTAAGDQVVRGVGLDPIGTPHITGNFVGTVDFDPGAGTFGLDSAATTSTGFLARLIPSPLGDITGRKFDDLNANGMHDTGEPYLNGWTVELFDDQNNLVATTVTADADLNFDGFINPLTERGWYRFIDQVPGDYWLNEVLQTGWVQTLTPTPSGPPQTLISLPIRGVFNDLDFGNSREVFVEFDQPTYQTSESVAGGVSMDVQLIRSGATDRPATVTVNLADGAVNPATGGSDYDNTSITITFMPGVTLATVNIPITADSIVEMDENVDLMLTTSQVNVILGTQDTATLTIIDDDTANVEFQAAACQQLEAGGGGQCSATGGGIGGGGGAGGNVLSLFGIQPDTGLIVEVNPATGAVIDSFPAPEALPIAVAGLSGAESGTTLLYQSSQVDSTQLYRLDPDDGSVLSVESMAASPNRGGLTYDGTSIFAIDNGNPVDRQAGFGGTVTDFLNVTPDSPGALGGDDLGRHFVVAGGDIVEFDPATPQTTLNSFAVPAGTQLAGLAFDGVNLYASDLTSDTLYTLDPDTGAIRDQVAVIGGELIGLGVALVPPPPPLPPGTDNFESADLTVLPWTTGGFSDWTVTSTNAANGTFSARSGAIGHSRYSVLSLAANTIAGNVQFARQVSSQAGGDFLRFFIDDVEQGVWSGVDPGFSLESFPVTAGLHTLTWVFSRDASFSGGLDTAFIDDVSLPFDNFNVFSDSITQTNVAFSPNVVSVDFTSAPAPVGDATLRIDAIADLGATSEIFTLDAEGLFSQDFFIAGGSDSDPVSDTITLPEALVQQLAADGTISFTLTPSVGVNNLGEGDVTLTLSYEQAGGGNPVPVGDIPVLIVSTDLQVPQTVDVNVTGGTATQGTDFTNTVTVTIPAGTYDGTTATAIPLNLAIIDENIVENDETIDLELSNVGGLQLTIGDVDGDGTTQDTTTHTILNDDSAVVSLTGDIDRAEGTGGTTNYNFDVVIDNPVQDGFELTFVVNDGTATDADDFDVTTASPLTFAGNANETQTITVAVDADSGVEIDEGFSIDLGVVGNTSAVQIAAISLGTDTATGDIRNDDTVVNADNTDNVIIVRQQASSADTGEVEIDGNVVARFDISIIPDLTINGLGGDDTLIVDFVNGNPLPGGGLNLHGGSNGAGGDEMVLRNGMFGTQVHTFNNASDGTVQMDGGPVITYTGLEPIDDLLLIDDRIFNFLATDDDITLTDDGDVNNGLNRLSSVASSETVNFVDPTGTLTINAGGGADTITVGLLNDLIAVPTDIILNGDDGADQFNITPNPVSNIDIDGGDPTALPGDVISYLAPGTDHITNPFTGTGFITLPSTPNLDYTDIEQVLFPPRVVDLSVNVNTASEAEETVVLVVLTAIAPVQGDQSVDLNITGAGITPGDYTLSDTTITILDDLPIAQAQFIVQNDDIVEALVESVTLSISNPTSGLVLGSVTSQTVDITDNDSATVSIADLSMDETDGVTTFSFDVTLSDPVDIPVEVHARTADDTPVSATAGVDYNAVADDTLTFVANTGPQTLQTSVTIQGDPDIEPDETFLVELFNLVAPARDVTLDSGAAQALATILDDDGSRITITGVTLSEGTNGTTDFNFDVSLNRGVAGGFDLDFSVVDGTATDADDFDVITTSPLTFLGTPGESHTITVRVDADTKVEADEMFTVVLGAISNLDPGLDPNSINMSGSPATGLINNDDTTTLAIAGVTQDEGTNGSTDFDFVVTLNHDVQGGFDVDFTVADGTATDADDFDVTTTSPLTFAGTAGETQTIKVSVNADSKVEADEAFTVALGALSNFAAGVDGGDITVNGSPATGAIDNDDTATLTIADVTLNEGTGGTTDYDFTVALDNPIQGGLNLAFTVDDGTATDADDFDVVTASPLDFAGTAGEMQTITVRVDADDKVEADEAFSVALGTISGLGAGIDVFDISTSGSPATGAIDNDDSASLSIADVTQAEGTGSSTLFNFTVTLDSPVQGGFDAAFGVNDGTATDADDFDVLTVSPLSFNGTANEMQTVSISVHGDNKVEADELFTVALGALGNFAAGVDAGDVSTPTGPATGTINNDDAATLTLTGVTSTEGTGGTTDFDFTVALDNPVQGGLDIDFAVNDGSATDADDFDVVTASPLSFAGNGGESHTITVTVDADNKVEADEIFSVVLGAISGLGAGVSLQSLTVAGSPALGVINNDDAATLSISDVLLPEGTSGGATDLNFNVTLDNPVQGGFDLAFLVNDGTATDADDFNLITFSPLVFSGGSGETQTITVRAGADSKVEADESFTVTLGALSALASGVDAGNISVTGSPATGTITNDDTTTLTIAGVTQDEGNGGTTDYNFSVALGNAVAGGFAVDFSVNDGTATAADDFTVVSASPLNFIGNANETRFILVRVDGDSRIELDEVFQVALGALSNLGAGVDAADISTAGSPATGTINNDDTATVSITGVTQTEGTGSNTTFDFDVTLDNAVPGGFDLSFSVADGTATDADDYDVVTAGPLQFAGTLGETQTISVEVLGDTKLEGTETFSVSLGTVSNLTVAPGVVSIATGTATGTINNDDQVTLSLSGDVTNVEGTGGTTDYVFTVTLDNEVQGGFDLDFAVNNDTATSGTDFNAATVGPLGFAGTANESHTISVSVIGDARVESQERFTVALGAVSKVLGGIDLANFNTAGSPSSGVINDDDVPGWALSETDGNTRVNESGITDSVSIVLTAQPVLPVTVQVGLSDPTEATVSQSILTFPPALWDQPQTVSITAIEDKSIDGDMTLTLTASIDDAFTDDAFDALPDLTATVEVLDHGPVVITSPIGTISANPPRIQWTERSDADLYEVMVVNAVTGQTVFQDTVLPGNGVLLPEPLPFGTYTSSVRGFVGFDTTPYSPPAEFLVPAESAPVIFQPGQEVLVSRPVIEWTPVPGATSYELMLVERFGASPQTIVVTVNGTSWTVDRDLNLGLHRAWVRAFAGPNNVSDYSPMHQFRVSTRTTVTAPMTNPGTTTPTVVWDSVPGAATYNLWVRNLTTGVSQYILMTGLTDTTYQITTPLPLGRYRAWAQAVDPNGFPAEWSLGRTFVSAPAPGDIDPVGSTFDTTPTFNFPDVDGAEYYDLWINNLTTGEDQVIRERMLPESEFTPTDPLAEGSYRAWARATAQGVQGAWTAAMDFFIGGRPTLTGPIGTVNVSQPVITWDPVGGADSYEIWFNQLGGQMQIINEAGLQGTSFTPAAPLADGTYRIWLKAISNGEMSDWSVPIDVTIDTVAAISAPAVSDGLVLAASAVSTSVADCDDTAIDEESTTDDESKQQQAQADETAALAIAMADARETRRVSDDSEIDVVDAVLSQWPAWEWWYDGDSHPDAAVVADRA